MSAAEGIWFFSGKRQLHARDQFADEKRLIVPFWQRAPERLRVLRILSSWLLLALPVGALFLQLTSGSSGAADKKPDECGLASVYSGVSEETASGEDTRSEGATAAHRTLPFGTKVLVSNQKNGQSAVVRITDRGPFVDGRIIDVSQIAARKLGFSGLTKVCLKILEITENISGQTRR
jgi:rare lipoprotein A